MEATASDPERAGAIRHDRRHPERRAGERALHLEHSRRALGHLQGRSRQESFARPAARRRACRVRGVPEAARCARARRAARRAIRQQPPTWRSCRYCIPFSFKDPYDTMDMRSTGGADARYDIDFPARDQNLGASAAQEGRHHLRQVGPDRIQRPRRQSGRPEQADQGLRLHRGYQRSTWGGNPSESYDTTRAASLGSSSGSAVSVSTNLVMCGLCEETVPRAADRPITIRWP